MYEATKGNKNPPFFGIIVLQKSNKDEKIIIIDGLKRITTLVIFVRVMLNILQKRAQKEQLDTRVKNEDFLESIKETYLIANHQAKLELAKGDKEFFERAIIDNETLDSKVYSQKLIEYTKHFFERELDKLETKKILELFEALQKIELIIVYVENKIEALVMFQMQHYREFEGNYYSLIDRFESDVVSALYTYCPKEDFEQKLDETTNIFKDLYIPRGDMYREVSWLSEWRLLSYFDVVKFFNTNSFMFFPHHKISEYSFNIPNKNEIEWIEAYLRELREAFRHIEIFLHKEKTPSVYADYLCKLAECPHEPNKIIYAFILKAYQLFGSDTKQLERVFAAIEIIALRWLICENYYSEELVRDIRNIFCHFNTTEDLEKSFKSFLKKHLTDEQVVEELPDIRYKVSIYILAHYENYLRNGSIRTEKLPFKYNQYLADIKLERIAPDIWGRKRKAGYCRYNENFREHYLRCIGNYVLPNETYDNEDNVPFKNKLVRYADSSLAQQREIKDFVKNGIWDKEAIDDRRKKIEKFVLEAWSFK